jgi:subtilisin family serine protease
MGPLFTTGTAEPYHDDMLLVRMKPAVGERPIGPAFAAFAERPVDPGMSALTYFERAGGVARVTPISRQGSRYANNLLATGVGSDLHVLDTTAFALERSAGLAAAALRANAILPEPKRAADTTSLITLTRHQNVRLLQDSLAQDPEVLSVSRVPIRYLTAPARAAVAPPPAQTLWNLDKIRWASARSTAGFKEATAIKVAVLDTGIDIGHPDLAGQIRGYHYLHPDLPTSSSDADVIGHGTHVAGTIAAAIGNAVGINGICACELHAWKIFDDLADLWENGAGGAGYAYYVDPVMYLRALIDCADQAMDVVNLSIGGPGAPDPTESEAFAELIAAGCTVVAAMGNERAYGSPTSYPAAIPGVIAVGATTPMDRVTLFSNRGTHITISAPGEAIWSTLPRYIGQSGWEAVRGTNGAWRPGKPYARETDYDAWSGTSMASPHVAGAAALFLSNGGARSSAAFRDALMRTADKVPAMGGASFSPDYGYGRLNLETLLASI